MKNRNIVYNDDLIRKCLCKPGDGSKRMDVPEIKMDHMPVCIHNIFLTIVPMRKIIGRLVKKWIHYNSHKGFGDPKKEASILFIG